MTEPSTMTIVCPGCGASGSGRYCAECATPLRGASCSGCGTALVTAAKYCHSCGVATSGARGTPARGSRATPTAMAVGARSRMMPWAVVVVAFAAVAALVLARRPDASASDATPMAGPIALGGIGGPTTLPDITNMSPRERAERLYDRTMMAKETGKTDSATFFATMAMVAYEQLSDRTLDDRYDLGRLAMVAGAGARARAEADTILASRPTHLLGLLLAEDAARARGDESAAKALHAKLVAAAPTERRAGLPEYGSHATELDAALARK